MRKIFTALREITQSGQATVLVTIAASSGSTPRGAGACMLVGREGRVCGTIGGGAVEHQCEQKALEVLRTGTSETVQYRLHENEIQDLGMICGGRVDVCFRYLPGNDPAALALAEAMEEAYSQGGTVYIFGGGHVAQALVPALAAIDFRCVVLEDREAFCDPALFPGAVETRLIDNARIADSVAIGADDYVVVMTRGHKDDQMVQAQVLRTPARYIGVIGSRRKAAGVFANLRKMGFGDADLARITTPVGLDIGAETPAEIAVSIAAQLIQKRAAGKP